MYVYRPIGIYQGIQRPGNLEILENENGHGKVNEHEKLAKSHGNS